jgi:CBS domain containing-hemolysin-like protein
VSGPIAGPTGLLTAAALIVAAGVFSAADASLASYSRARAEELVGDGVAGARRLTHLLDDRARYLNTALLLRLLCETSAAVIVTLEIRQWYGGARWPTILTAVGAMLVVSFVVIGVAPGRWVASTLTASPRSPPPC